MLEVVGFRCCLSLCLGLQYQVGLQSGCWEEAACGSVVALLWGGAAGLAPRLLGRMSCGCELGLWAVGLFLLGWCWRLPLSLAATFVGALRFHACFFCWYRSWSLTYLHGGACFLSLSYHCIPITVSDSTWVNLLFPLMPLELLPPLVPVVPTLSLLLGSAFRSVVVVT